MFSDILHLIVLFQCLQIKLEKKFTWNLWIPVKTLKNSVNFVLFTFYLPVSRKLFVRFQIKFYNVNNIKIAQSYLWKTLLHFMVSIQNIFTRDFYKCTHTSFYVYQSTWICFSIFSHITSYYENKTLTKEDISLE